MEYPAGSTPLHPQEEPPARETRTALFQPSSVMGTDQDVQAWARARPRRLEPAGLEQHRNRLFRAAYALSHSKEDAEDLVQETYEHVLRKPRFLHRDDALAYLMRVLRNRWSAQLQSAGRRRSSPAPPEDLEWVVDERADPDGSPLEVQLAYDAIAELSEPLRETIVAVDVAGLSYREAASALRTRTGTIMSRLFRARKALVD
jgi:RNA polymerase sigma-70 factor, ECF subfamily